jgi:aminopeptidase
MAPLFTTGAASEAGSRVHGVSTKEYRVPVPSDPLLPPALLARYADAIVKASLSLGKGYSLVVQGEHEHRELLVAVAESAYRAGARYVDVLVADPLVARARLQHGSDEALGAVSPWVMRRLRETVSPNGAFAAITGQAEGGYFDGIPPERVGTDYTRAAKATTFLRAAQLGMRARWTIAGWPTDYWAAQAYPELPALEGKRRLARDLLHFCRLTDADGKGSSGWLRHLRTITRRSEKLTRLGLTRLELRGPGTELRLGLVPGTRWLGGLEEMPDGTKLAPNMPTEETFTSPDARATEGTFSCTFPLWFRGRLIEGLRGEFRSGRLVRLDADSDADRDFVAAYLDSDANARRLGEIALVDSSSRIGQTGRVYCNTLLDENAAAHVAFGSGFGHTRSQKPARGVNKSVTHLDVMIGSPELEVTGVNARGRRVPLIRDGVWQI